MALTVFNGWFDKISLFQCSISALKCRDIKKNRVSSVFNDKKVSECLNDDIHDKFIVCPVDKARFLLLYYVRSLTKIVYLMILLQVMVMLVIMIVS